MKAFILVVGTLFGALSVGAMAQAGRIYTAPDPAAPGELKGAVNLPLTHAVAMERDRIHVYLATLSDGGKAFDFQHLPTGKYDLVLVTRDGQLFEGLNLGDDGNGLTQTQKMKLDDRIGHADSFFSLYLTQRVGVTGDVALAFVERFTGNKVVLKQSGEKLGGMVRRLEVVELHQATDDWQMSNTRHLYREKEVYGDTHFLKDVFTSELSGIRVIDAPKDLGSLMLSEPTSSPK